MFNIQSASSEPEISRTVHCLLFNVLYIFHCFFSPFLIIVTCMQY